MWGTIVRKALTAVPVALIAVTVVFLAVRLAPGDPARAVVGDQATQAGVEAVLARLGLDRPLAVQYVQFLGGLARLDLGESYINQRNVARSIASELPYTLDLAIASTVLSALIGIPLGIVSALRRNTWVDYVLRVVALIGLSAPAFVLAIILLLIFGLALPWFPVFGGGDLGNLSDRLYHLVLPAFSLGLISASFVARVTRSTMLDVLGEQYVVTAKSKGIHHRAVVAKHALRNALIPIITILGLYMGVSLGGAVLTEVVFNRPGIGGMLVGAILQRDYPVIEGCMVLLALLVVLINLVIDVIYCFVDPRVQYA